MESIRKAPKPTMMMPPTWFSRFMTSPPTPMKTLLIATPIIENTTENPRTKNTALSMMLARFIVTVPSLDWLMSARVVPDMYAKKAGIIGSMHGAQNDPSPAKAATAMVTSTTHSMGVI